MRKNSQMVTLIVLLVLLATNYMPQAAASQAREKTSSLHQLINKHQTWGPPCPAYYYCCTYNGICIRNRNVFDYDGCADVATGVPCANNANYGVCGAGGDYCLDTGDCGPTTPHRCTVGGHACYYCA